MKVSDLSGAQLDYWVARAQDMDGRIIKSFSLCNNDYFELTSGTPYRPSTHWAHGGPIIEREKINLYCDTYSWDARIGGHDSLWSGDHHATPLIAAMRIFVASKFGDEVPDVMA